AQGGVGSLATRPGSRVADVRATEDHLEVLLKDGRRISVPLDWYPRLKAATPEDRAVWEPCAAGHGIHLPRIDEDLSIEGILRGEGRIEQATPPRPQGRGNRVRLRPSA